MKLWYNQLCAVRRPLRLILAGRVTGEQATGWQDNITNRGAVAGQTTGRAGASGRTFTDAGWGVVAWGVALVQLLVADWHFQCVVRFQRASDHFIVGTLLA